MEIVCRKCQNKWDYKGNARRVSCSKCRTSIMIDNHKIKKAVSEIVKLGTPIVYDGSQMRKIVKYDELSDEQKQVIAIGERQKQTLTNRYVAEVKFPKTLWKDARTGQRFMGLDVEYVTFKVNEDGILSLA